MSLLSSSIPSLTGGVSQQPDSLRLPGQAEVQENALPSVIEGLIKRPPTDHVSGLTDIAYNTTHGPDIATHVINRDDNERYLVILNAHDVTVEEDSAGNPHRNKIRVYDLITGDEVRVYVEDEVADYIGDASATATRNVEGKFDFQTIGDVTFFTRKDKDTAKSTETSSTDQQRAIVFVKSTHSDYADASVIIDGVTSAVQDGDTTLALAAAIKAAIVGSDQAFSDGHLTHVNIESNKFSDDGHSYENGQQLKFELNPAEGTAEWPQYYDENGDTQTMNALTRLYVKDKQAGVYYTALSPGGATLDWKTTGEVTNALRSAAIGSGSAMGGLNDLVVEQQNNLLLISFEGGRDFDIQWQDGQGNSLGQIVKDSVQTFQELPELAPHGFMATVEGSMEENLDDFHVMFKADDEAAAVSTGTWEESIKENIEFTWDYDTMPHILIRQADGSFLAKRGSGRLATTSNGPEAEGDQGSSLYNNYLTLFDSNTITHFSDGDVVQVDSIGDNNGDPDYIQTGVNYFIQKKGAFTNGVQAAVALYETYDSASGVFSDPVSWPDASGAFLEADGGVQISKELYPKFKWADRQVGDDLSNPYPAYEEGKVSAITYFKNRLVFAVGETVCLSESGDYFNFFRTTALQPLVTRPFEVAGASTSVSNINTMLPFGDRVILMGDRSQYALLSRGDMFAAETASVENISDFPAEPHVHPVTSGPSIFFGTRRGDFSGLYQYAGINRDDIRMDAVEVSSHVPRFIKGNLRKLAANHQQGVLAALTNDDRGSLYFYNYFVSGGELLQNAFWKGTFNDAEIHHIEFIDNELIILVRHTSGFCIEKMVFKSGLVDTGLSYLNHVDRKFTAVGGEHAWANESTPITPPTGYEFEENAPLQVITDTGEILAVDSVDGPWSSPSPLPYMIHVKGDYEDRTVYVGEKYNFLYKFSEQLLREGNPPRPISQGRMNLRYGTLLYEDTGFFKVNVTPIDRNTYEYKLGAVLGITDVGETPVTSGRLKYPIHTKASHATIEVSNDTPLPTRLTGAEFEFSWTSRARRLV